MLCQRQTLIILRNCLCLVYIDIYHSCVSKYLLFLTGNIKVTILTLPVIWMIHMISTTSKYQVVKVSPGGSPMEDADGLQRAEDRLQLGHKWTMNASSHHFTLVHFNPCALAPFTIIPFHMDIVQDHQPRQYNGSLRLS